VNRHSAKKNEKRARIGERGPYIGASWKAKYSDHLMTSKLRIEKLKQRIDEPIACDIHARFTFFFPESVFYTKKGPRSAKLPDLSNLYELPQDVMQKLGIIANDTIICSHDGSRREPIEGSDYYLQITLFRYV
jgi:Holliday junction resolvase RusA-like endonuclease